MVKQEPKILWQPNPGPQTEALRRNEFEILYGGARGGGKTDAGMAFLLYHISNPRYRALVIRKNADDLKDWTDRAERMYAGCRAEAVGNPREFRFPSGAKIRTGHLNDADAYKKYQGHEYQNMLIEELTQISSEKHYETLIQSCRSTVDGIKPQVFCTTNPAPGEPGHKWVMNRFINIGKWGDRYTNPKSGLTRIFIPAKVQDNPQLMEKDPTYVKRLESISDERLRNAWLNGDWEDIDVEGAYYAHWMRNAQSENRIGFVPHEPNLLTFTAWDLGINDSMSIGFFQIFKREIRVIDHIRVSGESLEACIHMVKSKPYTYGGHYGPHDLAVRELTTGKTRIEAAQKLGVTFTTVANVSIEDGINMLRSVTPRMFFNEKTTEGLVESMFNYRQKWSEQLQMFVGPLHDEFSHDADMMRYFALGFKENSIIESTKYHKEKIPINAITQW